MSIINKTDNITSKSLDNVSDEVKVNILFDGYVQRYLLDNIDVVREVNLDKLEELFYSICEGIKQYSSNMDKYKDMRINELHVKQDIHERKKELEDIINKDYANSVKLLTGNMSDLDYGTYKEECEKKTKTIEDYRRITTEYNYSVIKSDDLYRKTMRLVESLDKEYEDLEKVYNKIDFNIHDFKAYTTRALARKIDGNIQNTELAKFIAKKIHEVILNELGLYLDLCDYVQALSFEELNPERLDLINEVYNRARNTRAAIDLKYDTIKALFMDAYYNRINPKRSVDITAYSSLLKKEELHMDRLESGLRITSTLDAEKMMDEIDNNVVSSQSKVIATRLNELISKNVNIK